MRTSYVWRANWAAGAFLLALSACLLLIRSAGPAAATDLAGVSVGIRYGCDDGAANPFVEVQLGQSTDSIAPRWLQVGLAVRGADDDLYPEGGPSLVALRGSSTLVRLAGPVTAGEHLFIRPYGGSEVRNLPLPAACSHIAPTPFGLQDPDIYGRHQVTCVGDSASIQITVKNNNDSPVDYTVLLVRKGGTLAGAQSQGIPVALSAQAKQVITVTQPSTHSRVYQYQVRVIAPDGQVTDVADTTLHCDSGQPPTRPSIIPTPVRPTPTATPSVGPTHSPTVSPTPSPTRPSASPSRQSASPTSPPASPGNGGPGASSGPASGAGAGGEQGPVLGAASSTSQPPVSARVPIRPPTATLSSSPSKVVVEATRLHTVFVNPGVAGAAVLVLLGFAGALGALLAANRASSRRR